MTDKPTRLTIPHQLSRVGITVIGSEYGTLIVTRKDTTLRTSFYKYDIDKTVRGFRSKAFDKYVAMLQGTQQKAEYEVLDLIDDFIRESWLELIGKKT